MTTRGCNYRDAEDLISYYAPARYLCDLMDSEIGLDHVTIFDFTQMLGPEGMASINKLILQHGFTKPRAFSTAALERCGHRAILGFNLRKMVTN